MTRKDLRQVGREELIDLALTSHARAQEEKTRREAAEHQLRWFKRQLFGARSERRLPADVLDAAQLSLGEVPENRSEPEKTPVRAHARVRARAKPETAEEEIGSLRFDDAVPRRRVVVPDPALAGLREGTDYTVISEKRSYRLAQRPAAYELLEIVRPVTRLNETAALCTAPTPPSVFPGSLVDVSLLAGLLVDKFCFHLPLYRQHQRMKAAGIHVSRSSLTNWVHQSVGLLEPLVRAQWVSVLESAVLAMDETPIRAGRKAKRKMHTGYFWPVYGDRDEIVFPFTSSRAHRHVEALLEGFEGTLLSDGYEGYARYAARREAVAHALCWSHTRRGFVRAEEVEPERAARALGWIQALYAIESEILERSLDDEKKLAVRAERSRPLVAALFEWLEAEMGEAALLPTSPFTKAALYALERRQGLEAFLANPGVPLDTNHLERALRPIPMGRKNWLFCWTEVGAEAVGRIQSLVQTCVLQGVDPYTYLVDVLQRVDTHPAADVHTLTPRLWKQHFAHDPLPSLLDESLRRQRDPHNHGSD